VCAVRVVHLIRSSLLGSRTNEKNGTPNVARKERCSIPFSLTKKHDEGHSDCIGGFALGAKPQKLEGAHRGTVFSAA